MGKYILYAGILWAALGCGAKPAEGHLFAFRSGQDARTEIREMQAGVPEERIYKRLGEKKYLVLEGEGVVMLDTECLAAERIISRGLVERVEQEAAKRLHETGKTGDLGGKGKKVEKIWKKVLTNIWNGV